MKWFQHFSNARYDPKVMRLLKKYHLRGYGLFFLIIEFIASQLESGKPVPDLEETSHDMAEFAGEDPLLIEEIVKFCINEKLFEYNDRINRITCLKLLFHLDNAMSQNPEIKKTLNNFKKLQDNFSDLKHITLPYTTLHNNKEKKQTSSLSFISAKFLFKSIMKNSKPTKFVNNPPDINKWSLDIEKLNRIDGVSYSKINQMITWCTAHDFWQGNILSGNKLRKNYPQLEIQKKKIKSQAETLEEKLKREGMIK